jgi:hypothetical protein
MWRILYNSNPDPHRGAASGEEDFFQYKHIEIWFSLLWLLPTPGTMVCTNLNLHYIRKLSRKTYELSGSGEEDF